MPSSIRVLPLGRRCALLTNALKKLQTGRPESSPVYVLTPTGALTLAEMASPGRMTHGYAPGSNQAVRLAKAQPPQQAHPARIQRAKRPAKVKEPRPPVASDRVRAVLTHDRRCGLTAYQRYQR